MKRILLILGACFLMVNFYAIRNWQSFTNTTHIYDMTVVEDKIYIATWGGLDVYDMETDSFLKTFLPQDGLLDMDIRAISYQQLSGTLLLGTLNNGVNRFIDGEFLIPLNDVIGLPDNRVNAIANSNYQIYVATDEGITVFVDDDTFPYPLPTNHFGTHNGLASNQVNDVILTDDGYLMCATDNGINYVHTSDMHNPDAWRHFHAGNSLLPGNIVNGVSVMGNTFAVATRNGLIRINDVEDQNEWIVYNVANNYPDVVSDEILTAFIDSSSNIWFTYGIWNDIILYIDYPPFNPEQDNPIDNAEMYAVKKISSGHEFTIWQKEGIIEDDDIAGTSIKGFKEIDNKIYAYSWGLGFFYLEEGYWHNRRPDSIVASNITDIAVDQNGVAWTVNHFLGGTIKRKGSRGVSGFDGLEWTNFRAETSPLRSNRNFRVATDNKNRKWFGSWVDGISVYDEETSAWYHLHSGNGLNNNVISEIISDNEGNIWISNYTGGMYIFDIDAIEDTANNIIQPITTFELFNPDIGVSDVIRIHRTSDKTFFGSRYSGIRYWDDDSFPRPHVPGDHWRRPPVATNTYVYDITSRQTPFGEEIWIAAESGLFMFNTHNSRWYRYGTSIKREVWLNNAWRRDPDLMPEVKLYFIDEERLYGAVPTFPKAIFIDPFDRIWIGSEANGITLYDLTTDRYTIYNTDNSPLISNNVTSLAYDPYSGNLFIGTIDGLNTVEIGRLYKEADVALSTAVAYPNPFKPEEGEVLVIANRDDTIMPQGNNRCRIYNKNGELVVTLEEDRFFKFSWNGNNAEGKKCGSGVYFYVVSSEAGETSKGTIVLIR